MQRAPVHTVNERDTNLPLRVTNNCQEEIYPGILTQSGVGPASSGFKLSPGGSVAQTVSADWRGRVWARTNCTFINTGSSVSGQGGITCSTGDCGQFVQCQGAGQPPATLAEFTLASDSKQSFYDVSLVDGYNLPMGVIALWGGSTRNSSSNSDIPPNLTNPVCIGTASQLAPIGDKSDEYFGTNLTYPLPLEQSLTNNFVQRWCPWPLQVFPPQKPGDGVYPYPDDNIVRPHFDPCLSACAKWNTPEYCCTGKYQSPDTCIPSYYSIQAKQVCPDAYSYAYDDQTSTFVVPMGAGFEIVFCPAGRSSNILAVFGNQLRQLAQTGHATRDIIDLAQNRTYIAERTNSSSKVVQSLWANLLVVAVLLLVW